MSQKERQRYHLLKMVIGGKITLKETGSLMGVSYRHAKRLKKIKGSNLLLSLANFYCLTPSVIHQNRRKNLMLELQISSGIAQLRL